MADVSAKDLEFIELYNPGSESVALKDWRLAVTSDPADDLVFDTETIQGKGTLVVVGFDPSDSALLTTFRNHYSIDASVTIVGPFSDSLSNNYGIVKLLTSDDPPVVGDPRPSVLSDEVFYDDQLPWAVDADGLGAIA